MNIYEIIIKLKNINEIDVSVILDHERLIKEFLIMDYTILLIFKFDIPFRKI